MKLIRVPKQRKMKQINYFGITLTVPAEAKYICVDSDGEIIIWYSVLMPFIRTFGYKSDDWCGEVIEYDLGQVDLEGLDWRHTLVDLGHVDDEDEELI